MKDTDIQHRNGKLVKIGWRDYNAGDQAIMSVSILQCGKWIVICDHNINEEV